MGPGSKVLKRALQADAADASDQNSSVLLVKKAKTQQYMQLEMSAADVVQNVQQRSKDGGAAAAGAGVPGADPAVAGAADAAPADLLLQAYPADAAATNQQEGGDVDMLELPAAEPNQAAAKAADVAVEAAGSDAAVTGGHPAATLSSTPHAAAGPAAAPHAVTNQATNPAATAAVVEPTAAKKQEPSIWEPPLTSDSSQGKSAYTFISYSPLLKGFTVRWLKGVPPLGQGGCGKVYAVVLDPPASSSDRPWQIIGSLPQILAALKSFEHYEGKKLNPDEAAAFGLNEEQQMGSLRGVPYILQLRGVVTMQQPGGAGAEAPRALVLERCMGSLVDVCKGARWLPARWVLQDIMVRVLKGLEQLWARGIVHRDMKAANVMITLDGRVVLSDFGSAVLLGSAEEQIQEAVHSVVCSMPAASPEIWAIYRPFAVHRQAERKAEAAAAAAAAQSAGAPQGQSLVQAALAAAAAKVQKTFGRAAAMGAALWRTPVPTEYGRSIDIWGVGAILASMLFGSTLVADFPGDIVAKQDALLRELRLVTAHEYERGDKRLPKRWRDGRGYAALPFLRCCCNFDPAKRSSPAQLLQHPWLADAVAAVEAAAAAGTDSLLASAAIRSQQATAKRTTAGGKRAAVGADHGPVKHCNFLAWLEQQVNQQQQQQPPAEQ